MSEGFLGSFEYEEQDKLHYLTKRQYDRNIGDAKVSGFLVGVLSIILLTAVVYMLA